MLLYPTGIVSTFFYVLLLSGEKVGLYADATLNAYYLIMSFYGWFFWTFRRSSKPLPVTFSNKDNWFVAFLIVLISWVLLYWLLRCYSNSSVPFWDACVSSLAWAGMWLLARRKVETWLFLNISNFIAIPLYIYKGLALTSLLTIFLFIVACFGYRDWIRIARNYEKKVSV